MLDPICDMTVELARAAGKFGFDGETYFFVVSIVRNYYRLIRENILLPQRRARLRSRQPHINIRRTMLNLRRQCPALSAPVRWTRISASGAPAHFPSAAGRWSLSTSARR
jgi:hypothetical protein